MTDFTPRTLCILGRQPALGLAELESLFGASHVRPFGEHALLDLEACEINFRRLGGTIKVARILNAEVGKTWRSAENHLLKNSPGRIDRMPEGVKLTIGISAYGIGISPAQIEATGLKLKKIIRASGRPSRVTPNNGTALSSAQVLHNKLTSKGGWELILASDGQNIILAQTLFVQDIEAYAARDQARPARDARVGMLPPKLAQIIINLSAGRIERDLQLGPQNSKTGTKTSSQVPRISILDPFCGTGVVLQEALLVGYNVQGSDLETKMVEYTKTNLAWLVKSHPDINGLANVEQGDATNKQWAAISTVASETYLGRPLSTMPSPAKLKEIIGDVNTILSKFLLNLAPQIKPNRPLCLAVPAWLHASGQITHLPLIDQIGKLGYNRLEFKHVRSSDLVYFRPGQTVARQLLVISRR